MKTLVAYMILLTLTASLTAVQLVSNGSFDQGPDGLDNWQASTAEVNMGSDTAANPKAFVASSAWGIPNVVCIQTNGSTNDGSGRGIKQVVAIGDHDQYALGCKFGFINIGSYSSITVTYRDAADNAIADSWFQWTFNWEDAGPGTNAVYNNTSNGLADFSVVLTRDYAVSGNSTVIPNNAVYAEISLKQHYDGYRTYFDDVSLEPVGVYNGNFSTGTSPYGLDGWEASGIINLGSDPSATGMSDSAWVRGSFWGGAWTDVLSIQSANNDGNGEGVMQYVRLAESSKYDLAFKFGFTNIGSYSTITVNWRDADGNAISGAGWFQWAFDWEDAGPGSNAAYNNNSSGMNDKVITLTRGAATAGNTTIVPETAVYAIVSLKQHYTGYQTYFDDVAITPYACGSEGYLDGDLDQNCYVDLNDFAILTDRWLNCTDPQEPSCDSYWK